MEIIPAILPRSRADLDAKLGRLYAIPRVTTVQIDAVDGRFASPSSWPYASPEEFKTFFRGGLLPHADRFRYDADLMTEDPTKNAALWSAHGAIRITVHAESAHNLAEVLTVIRARHGQEKDFAPELFSLGVALSVETDLKVLEPHFATIDYVQLMGIRRIGRQGEPFDERVVGKVRALRKIDRALPIQVDGGVTLASARTLLDAGADRLVVGHALFEHEDVARELEKFVELSHSIRAKAL